MSGRSSTARSPRRPLPSLRPRSGFGRSRRQASHPAWPGLWRSPAPPWAICAVSSSNSCHGSRVEAEKPRTASAGKYSAAPPEPASASHDAIPVRGPWKRERRLVLFSACRSTLLEEHVFHTHHRSELDWRCILFGRDRDQMGRVHPDYPAYAALIPRVESSRKGRAGALSQVRSGPRQVRRRV